MNQILLRRSHLLRGVPNGLSDEVVLVLVQEIDDELRVMDADVAQHPAHAQLCEAVLVSDGAADDPSPTPSPLANVDNNLRVEVSPREVQHGHAGRALSPRGRIFPTVHDLHSNDANERTLMHSGLLIMALVTT